ncbi:uncharacterized protein LOC129192968 isoform X5 [Dunckerocampus dactyliophorus]|uniref:uncharacterized protein LOC129192968 isoform X5 n=1 Tax=Dunckerocampus dactyliophorus TaxID=161453 RepID=UPI0024069DF1|nr:uncharacterized protein LOC129192968 isoform X5 [Dunckerocampus dactyliophorus]
MWGSNNTCGSTTNQASVDVSRVVSSVTGLVTTTPEAMVLTSGNLTSFKAPGDHEAPTPSVLSAAETNTVLKGIMVAAQALVLLSIFLLSSLGMPSKIAQHPPTLSAHQQ